MRAWRGEGLLAESLAACGRLQAASGYAIAPRSMRAVSFDGVAFHTVEGAPPAVQAVDLADAYQVVLFDESGVFRWAWDQRDRLGRWSWLDDEVAEREMGWRRLPVPKSKQGAHGESVTRLVQGAVPEVSTVPGWTMTTDGASAPVWVPITAPKSAHLVLRVVEYVSEDSFGNVAVTAERPCGWGIA